MMELLRDFAKQPSTHLDYLKLSLEAKNITFRNMKPDGDIVRFDYNNNVVVETPLGPLQDSSITEWVLTIGPREITVGAHPFMYPDEIRVNPEIIKASLLFPELSTPNQIFTSLLKKKAKENRLANVTGGPVEALVDRIETISHITVMDYFLSKEEGGEGRLVFITCDVPKFMEFVKPLAKIYAKYGLQLVSPRVDKSTLQSQQLAEAFKGFVINWYATEFSHDEIVRNIASTLSIKIGDVSID